MEDHLRDDFSLYGDDEDLNSEDTSNSSSSNRSNKKVRVELSLRLSELE